VIKENNRGPGADDSAGALFIILEPREMLFFWRFCASMRINVTLLPHKTAMPALKPKACNKNIQLRTLASSKNMASGLGHVIDLPWCLHISGFFLHVGRRCAECVFAIICMSPFDAQNVALFIFHAYLPIDPEQHPPCNKGPPSLTACHFPAIMSGDGRQAPAPCLRLGGTNFDED
jgi:hypothetical protein